MHLNLSLFAPKRLTMQTLCCCSPSSEAEQNIQISEPCNQTYHRPKEMMAFYHVLVDGCLRCSVLIAGLLSVMNSFFGWAAGFELPPEGIVICCPQTNSR